MSSARAASLASAATVGQLPPRRDIVLQVQLVWYASAGNGSGLFFRGSDDGLQGLLFTYVGGGTYKLFDFDGSTVVARG